MDSPGHSAQYCNYTLMENDTKDLLCSIIIDKRMTDLKSTNMEKEGLIRGLRTLRENRVVVKELVTDASTTIAAMMMYFTYLNCRLHRCFCKRSGTYSWYKEKVPKTYTYVEQLLQDILHSVATRIEPLRAPVTLTPTDPRKIKRSISGITPPPTKFLMASKKSRIDEK
ncbi:uncharacterized protein LOC128551799 [Mercenaria mercenaria]|uniref:uncharacterized protein LOC128551799 n=1 Tax=Mercenaria mercenaria TaxID=6596 RepID=UPI00234EFFDB|nr:uncharacterized protein LOC128551799 [Mercenaria mercenaria]